MLAATLPVAALACQLDCAFEEPAGDHHASHHHDAMPAAPSSAASIGALSQSCIHAGTVAPAIIGDAFQLALPAVLVVSPLDHALFRSDANASPLTQAAHSPPGTASRSSVLRI